MVGVEAASQKREIGGALLQELRRRAANGSRLSAPGAQQPFATRGSESVTLGSRVFVARVMCFKF
eukprot:1114475-Alexandrium_andersonii.AAC.1